MLDGRERLVEVVQQSPPLRVRLRTTEPHGVILKPIPPDEEQVTVRSFQASLKVQRLEPCACGDDGLSFSERHLELGFLARPDVEYREFCDHDEDRDTRGM